jgi:hypothetical protein
MAYNSMLKEIYGLKDARSLSGELLRGKNIYNGVSFAAQRGGPNIGRPKKRKTAIERRLRKNALRPR